MNKTKWNHWQKNRCGKLKRTEEEKTQNTSKKEEEIIRDSRGLGGGEGSRKEEVDLSLNHVTHARLSFFFFFSLFFPSLFLSRRSAKKRTKKTQYKKASSNAICTMIELCSLNFSMFSQWRRRERKERQGAKRESGDEKWKCCAVFAVEMKGGKCHGWMGGWTTQGWWTRSKDRKRLRWVNKKPPEHRAELKQ